MNLDNTSNGVISDFNMPRLKSRQISDTKKEVMEPGIVRKLDSSQYHILTSRDFYFTRPADRPKRKANLNDLDRL